MVQVVGHALSRRVCVRKEPGNPPQPVRSSAGTGPGGVPRNGADLSLPAWAAEIGVEPFQGVTGAAHGGARPMNSLSKNALAPRPSASGPAWPAGSLSRPARPPPAAPPNARPPALAEGTIH